MQVPEDGSATAGAAGPQSRSDRCHGAGLSFRGGGVRQRLHGRSEQPLLLQRNTFSCRRAVCVRTALQQLNVIRAPDSQQCHLWTLHNVPGRSALEAPLRSP